MFWYIFDIAGRQGFGGKAESIRGSIWGAYLPGMWTCIHEQVPGWDREEEENGNQWWNWICSWAGMVPLPILDVSLLVLIETCPSSSYLANSVIFSRTNFFSSYLSGFFEHGLINRHIWFELWALWCCPDQQMKFLLQCVAVYWNKSSLVCLFPVHHLCFFIINLWPWFRAVNFDVLISSKCCWTGSFKAKPS